MLLLDLSVAQVSGSVLAKQAVIEMLWKRSTHIYTYVCVYKYIYI